MMKEKYIRYIARAIVSVILLVILDYVLARKSTSFYTLISLLSQNGYSLTQGEIRSLEMLYGYNSNLFYSVSNYLISFFTGNWGYSIFYGRPVISLVLGALIRSLILIAGSLGISIPLILLITYLSIKYLGSFQDNFLNTILIILYSIPEVVIATLLFILLPPNIISPMLTLAVIELTFLYMFVRRNLTQLLVEHYNMIEFFVSLGLDGRIISKEILRLTVPLLLVAITYSISTSIPALIFVETVFNYPGIGYMMVQAINNSDYPLASGCFILFSIISIILNLIADVTNSKVDWRVK
ncbi:hypothetical protein BFU36_00435 [Sulfolobus sp. A20]|uniref:ABC transporter permease subunit n=1 Tax=Sulfolobaceae TaxID=118883 RepID=UPI000845D1D4|nr:MULTISPECIES: ABC transporter permease [unclassified Sulfolobus]TRM76601.1 ABC transporter permease [Sulfolobus sp. E5]TRM76984.1 ABC transporter permease [Sulfolobus sp. A20-N-F8]TRM78369.1 ABC transporter permease [Sulfolobus sp. B5]TRM80653.1 ABC transporter permease [Sulfolobus sp. A20-N-F6]TRM81977.1 ABC transporter permease [Sulfolobus sp. D5]TRM85405.1 ABC transporter permease [Sulfolobus sp. F3]TRM87124.1 ABC transporter permease [Sulfolobus sp. E3]TRM92552.1 ABC transporter perm